MSTDGIDDVDLVCPDFEVFILDEDDVNSVQDNAYVQKLSDNCYLSLLQPNRAKNAFQKEMEKGVFQLFLSKSLWEAMLGWTNIALKKKGKTEISLEKLMAYVGLELGMSLVQMGAIHQYWGKSHFSGHPDFREIMSRNDFQAIRAAIQFHPPSLYDPTQVNGDPLWHCRCFLEHFQHNCSTVAVPLGSSALDEASCRTSARTRAKTYMPNKPMKYAMRFYAVVGSREVYCHSFWDNGSGNKLPLSPGERYTQLFRDLRTPFNKAYADDPTGKICGVAKDSASALWSLQMAHQTKKQPDPSGKRHIFMDNFYTRHTLAEKVKVMTDGEIRITGTCRLNVINTINKVGVKKGIDMLKEKPRGSWVLVRAFNPPEMDADTMGKRAKKTSHHEKMLKTCKKKNSKTMDDDEGGSADRLESQEFTNVAPNCGYIIYKDRKDVIFYTNDLAATPNELVVIGNDDSHAIHCVNGLGKLHRWTDDCMLQREVFMAPAIIVAYNLFMNAVDRMDQRRQPLACQRREKRLSMSLFTMILDLACSNGYAVACTLSTNYKRSVPFREFKRRVADQLTMPWRTATLKRKEQQCERAISETPPDADSLRFHILSDNEKRTDRYRKDGACYLCTLIGEDKTGADTKSSKMGCFRCGQCYHLRCFNLMHQRHLNSSEFNEAMDSAIRLSTRKRKRSDIVTNPANQGGTIPDMVEQLEI